MTQRFVFGIFVVALLLAAIISLSSPQASYTHIDEEPLIAPSAIPEGYEVVDFISEEQIQVFEEASFVIAEDKDYQAILITNKGEMLVDLFEEAPNTINNFIFLSLHHYYEGIVFHRVLEDFMAQTGDPTGTGSGGPGYRFDDEIAEGLSHTGPGILSMANAGPNTNGSQFFLTFAATPWLDGKHAIFGEITGGIEVLDELQRIDPNGPSAVVYANDSLAALAEQGINLSGDPETSIADFLEESLGTMPAFTQTFDVEGYKGVIGRVQDDLAVGFYPNPDVIEAIYIIAKDMAAEQ